MTLKHDEKNNHINSLGKEAFGVVNVLERDLDLTAIPNCCRSGFPVRQKSVLVGIVVFEEVLWAHCLWCRELYVVALHRSRSFIQRWQARAVRVEFAPIVQSESVARPGC